MALITLGAVVGRISGKLGAHVFARNGSANYVRLGTKPTYPGTEKQQVVAGTMSYLVNYWSEDLTTAEREAWNGRAAAHTFRNRLGDSMNLSGFNAWMRSNLALRLAQMGVTDTPPVAFNAAAPSLTIVHTFGTGLQVTAIAPWDNSHAGKLAFWMSPNLNPTTNFYKGPFTTATQHGHAEFDVLPVSIHLNAELQAGTRVFIRFRDVCTDGALSAAQIYKVDVPDPMA